MSSRAGQVAVDTMISLKHLRFTKKGDDCVALERSFSVTDVVLRSNSSTALASRRAGQESVFKVFCRTRYFYHQLSMPGVFRKSTQ